MSGLQPIASLAARRVPPIAAVADRAGLFRRPANTLMLLESLHEVPEMSAHEGDELTQILATHREHVAAAQVAAQQRARDDENARHDCEAPLRRVAFPPLREWSLRLATEGYPATIEDRLGCHPPSLVFRLAPHGAPASSLTLACEVGPAVRFRMNVDGREIIDDLQIPLEDLQTSVVLERLGRFVTAALAATIPTRSDCWP